VQFQTEIERFAFLSKGEGGCRQCTMFILGSLESA